MTIRKRRREIARDLCRALTLVAACMLALSVWTMFSATRSPAAAAATSVGTVELTPTSGTSETVFGLATSTTPQCAGDTASGGYNWSTFMVSAETDLTTLVMTPNGPNPVEGEYRASLLSAEGNTMAVQSTGIAGGPGQPGLISGIPQFTFEFYLPGEVPAGEYQVGIVCTKDGGKVVDTYYSRGMTVSVNSESGGPAAIDWAQAATPPTTTTSSSTTSTTEGTTTTTEATTTTTDGTTTTTDGTTPPSDDVDGSGVFGGGSPSAASPVATAGQLPYTGSSPVPMIVWAIALIVFGRMAMLLGKRPKVIGDEPTG